MKLKVNFIVKNHFCFFIFFGLTGADYSFNSFFFSIYKIFFVLGNALSIFFTVFGGHIEGISVDSVMFAL